MPCYSQGYSVVSYSYTIMRSAFLSLVARVATAHPAAWMYSFVAVGIAVGIAVYSTIGWWVGTLLGAPQTTQYLALAWYGYWLIQSFPVLHAHCDRHIQMLTDARSLINE